MFVQIGMDIVPLRHCRKLAVIKHPDRDRGVRNRNQPDLIASAGGVYILVQAIMKEVVAITAAGVGWANPDGMAWINFSVGAPRHL